MKTAVKDVMTPRVIWVREDATFREMAAALRQHRALNGQPGVFSGILHRRDAEKPRGITAGDLMTVTMVAVAPEDTVEHAARLMYSRKVKRLPVVDANGHLVGIISRADVLSVFDRRDREILGDIGEMMLDELLDDPKDFKVTVEDGVVTLAGVPETNEVGHYIVRKVRHVQGVVAVRDRLSYPDVYSIVAGPVL